jgi:predicted nucleic acid-binding protein
LSYLLDTNVVSEWARPRPDPGVVAWLDAVDEDRVFLSVVTLAELRRGIARLPPGAKRDRLDEWLRRDLLLRFEGRILLVDAGVADSWGEIVAARDAMGRPIAAMDALIAATARIHKLALITRNEADFSATVELIVNPWTS